MIIPVNPSHDQVTFKGKYGVRRLWLNGYLPEVTHDIYGLPLTRKTCTREHIIPKSLGGPTNNSNIALADKYANGRRGTEKLSKFTTFENVVNYLKQFFNILIKDHNGETKFDGNKYIRNLQPSLKHEGFNLNIKG